MTAFGDDMTDELDDALHARIVQLTDTGNRICEEGGDLRAAIAAYQDALDLLPPPVERWEAASWILTALGDCHFLLGEHVRAHELLTRAMRVPGALGTGFIHLRLGQVQLELGNTARAADELARAYMAEGRELFADEDPKYYAFLRTRMRGLS